MTLFGIELSPLVLVGLAGALFGVGGLSLLGHVVVSQRDAVSGRVDRLAQSLPDRVATRAAASIQLRAPANLVGTGMLTPAEEAELIRCLRFLPIRPERILEVFFVTRLAMGVVLAVVLALCLSRYGEPLPKLLRLAVLALLGGAFGWLMPLPIVGLLASRRIKAIERGLPDAIELLVVSVEAGLALEDSLDHIVPELRRSQPALADELGKTVADLKILPSREVALEKLMQRVDVPSIRSLVTTLSQTLRYGTPLVQALRVVAAELRNEMLIKLEERANRLPAILTVPMIVFFLPAIFLLVGGPAILNVIDAFGR
jgi:tight adherence protein C